MDEELAELGPEPELNRIQAPAGPERKACGIFWIQMLQGSQPSSSIHWISTKKMMVMIHDARTVVMTRSCCMMLIVTVLVTMAILLHRQNHHEIFVSPDPD